MINALKWEDIEEAVKDSIYEIQYLNDDDPEIRLKPLSELELLNAQYDDLLDNMIAAFVDAIINDKHYSYRNWKTQLDSLKREIDRHTPEPIDLYDFDDDYHTQQIITFPDGSEVLYQYGGKAK